MDDDGEGGLWSTTHDLGRERFLAHTQHCPLPFRVRLKSLPVRKEHKSVSLLQSMLSASGLTTDC